MSGTVGSMNGKFASHSRNKERDTGLQEDTNVHVGDDAFVVVLIEQRALIRECLTDCLEQVLGAGTVFSYASVADWRKSTEIAPRTSLLLLSNEGKEYSFADSSRELSHLSARGKLPPVVVLSDAESTRDILSALDKGAKAFIPTSVSLRVIVEILHLVRAGGVFVPASGLMSVRHAIESVSTRDKLRAAGHFTEKQAAVVEALRQGKANKIIAHELKMQESTVKVHVRNIMKKLKAHNRTQVAYLTQHLFE